MERDLPIPVCIQLYFLIVGMCTERSWTVGQMVCLFPVDWNVTVAVKLLF